eukprot:CAMPEP_0178852024 /NCGR_PEP_ID=MMETSP0746-20121128/21442_1 /TAXON_ID=913974 /ORGANISM="Nitzschia punctata, Strain CCMP561" /LENGTH=51 /DNA_ID=CAMNT_0020517643 /DNA_START=363 /DNA_END=515 /DNA_ORIENTATION=+
MAISVPMLLLWKVAPAAGEIVPSLVFPYFLPTKYAPTSENAKLNHDQKMKT